MGSLPTPDASVGSVDASDAAIGNIDAHHDGSVPVNCTDAGSTLIYVITGENELFSFYPPTRRRLFSLHPAVLVHRARRGS